MLEADFLEPSTAEQRAEWRARYIGIESAREQASLSGNSTAQMGQSYAMAALADDAIPTLLADVDRLEKELSDLRAETPTQ